MPNKHYLKGVRKERKIVNDARLQNKISFRSAGSHSPIDVTIIDTDGKTIKFIQCKPTKFSKNKKKLLEDKYANLNGQYNISFEVL